MTRVDSVQWPAYKIANSANNWHDYVTGYAIGADVRMQWDDTNHTRLPEGTAELTENVSDYSWLTDQQGNAIITLIGVSILNQNSGLYEPIEAVDRSDSGVDTASFGQQTGVPTAYDKISDNIIRLNYKPAQTVSSGIKFFFQRVGSYFSASDTTKAPGVAPILHRGYVIASSYDVALALGLPNLQALSVERQREEQRVVEYFSRRNNDEKNIITHKKNLFI